MTMLIGQVLIVLAFAFVCGCESAPKSAVKRDSDSGGVDKSYPIEVIVFRDGETKAVKFVGLSSGAPEMLCFVRVKDPEIQGEVYLSPNWRMEGERPMSIPDAMKAMNHVEVALREYYGAKELEKIKDDREKLTGLSVEEMMVYMKNPELNDKLDAHFALELVDEFREYFSRRIKK